MTRLSSHPLPPAALRVAALRRIYEETPPTPPAGRTGPKPASLARSEPSLLHPPSQETPPPPDGAPLLGSRYALERELDAGGTAIIHLARDLALGQRCAVKLLKPHAAMTPLLRSCFLAGARGAMGVTHPNVVRVLAVHEPGDHAPYAVMELLEGEPLHELVSREERLMPDLVLALARGAASGLAAAHAAGIVHCDVKPENLFVVGTGATRSIKVLDFDLAWMAGSAQQEERHILRGTAKYMAPEQIVGDEVDSRTDVYSLGVVLFRMITGHLPFDLELGATLLRHHLFSPIPPPSWLVDDLDPRLDAIVVRATRKDPNNRYQDMAALLADLDALALDLELSSPPAMATLDRYPPRSDHARAAARALVDSAA